MLSKSLIQFSVDGWGCMPSLLFTWGQGVVEESEVTQLCPSVTLCDPMDCSLPGSFVHGIFQVGVLEWIAIPSPEDLPDPGIEPRSPAM